MEDLGAPASYMTLREGVPVYSKDGGEVGKIEHVLADVDADIFDGIVLDKSVLPGGHRFVDAPEVEEVYERGVVLKLSAAEAERLPEPSENPAAVRVDPGAEEGQSLMKDKLRRAWDLISGKY